MSDAGGNIKVVSWKAVAVSIGNKLEVYPKNWDNKEALSFVGTYTSGTKNLSVDECQYDTMLRRAICLHSRIVEEREANGDLENGNLENGNKFAGFVDKSSATFTVTKTKNGDAYDVIISIFEGKSIDGVEYSYAAGVRSLILSFRPP